MENCVYWVRLPEHTDILTQGYVGVTNNFTNRMSAHKSRKDEKSAHFKNAIGKYGWGTLIKTKIVIGDSDYCYLIENKLRPTQDIGWNIQPGGEKNASIKGRVISEEHKKAISAANTGRIKSEETRKLISTNKKGKKYSGNNFMQKTPGFFARGKHPKAIKIEYNGVIYDCVKDLADFLNINYGTLTSRIKQNPERWGYKVL